MSAFPREQPLPPSGTCDLIGTVRIITWSSWSEPDQAPDEPGMVIAKLCDPPDGSAPGATVKGPCPEDGLEPGVAYRFVGRWAEHPRFGRQFQFSTFVQAVPASRRGVIAYLTKLCPNVGERKADMLWDNFQARAVEIVRTAPERVAAAHILSLDQAREAAAALSAHAALEATKLDLFGLFDRRGFPNKIIEACIAKWGAAAHQRLRRNPYCLLTAKPKLPGAGFVRCDKLYLDLGKPSAALKRQMLAAWHMLRVDGNGHTWLSFPCVREAIVKAIREGAADPHRAVQLGIRSHWLATHTDAGGQTWIAEHRNASNEHTLADQVAVLRRAAPLWASATTDIVGATADGQGGLSPHQLATLGTALREPVALLTGTPGTGKTYAAAQIVKWLACRLGLDQIAVCAPTGKAAVRISAAMKAYALDLTATTVHRLLEIGRNGHDGDGWGFSRNVKFPLLQKVVIVDEASMLDTDLAAALLAACAPGTHVLLIGDPYQLPPVGHGAPLRDLIAAGVPNGQLSEIRRNAGLIVHACARIKDGQPFETSDRFDPEAGLNLKHIEADTAEEAAEFLQAVLARFQQSRLFGDPIEGVQILTALNGKSKVSRTFLNRILQQQLNPGGQTAPQNPFRIGDKIICIKNNGYPAVEYQLGSGGGDQVEAYRQLGGEVYVANGDQGRVLAVGPQVAVARFTVPDRTIKIHLGKAQDAGDAAADPDDDSGHSEASQRTGTGCDFALAYAITCHKSQGSEWPCVIVMVDDSPGARRLCSREHVYTAISRARQLCITIGKRATLLQQCRKVSLDRRKTFLRELLATEGQP